MLIPRKPPKTPAKIESGSTITAAQATRLVRGAIISEPVAFPGCLLSPNRHPTPRFQIRVLTPTGVPTRFEQPAGYHPQRQNFCHRVHLTTCGLRSGIGTLARL